MTDGCRSTALDSGRSCLRRRSKEERTRMVGRAVVLKGKIHEAYRKNLVRQRQTFSIADPTQGSK